MQPQRSARRNDDRQAQQQGAAGWEAALRHLGIGVARGYVIRAGCKKNVLRVSPSHVRALRWRGACARSDCWLAAVAGCGGSV